MSEFNAKKYFNTISSIYKKNEVISLGFTTFFRKKMIFKLNNRNNLDILDVMCGTGENIKIVLANKIARKITGVDFSEEMNKMAQKNIQNNKVDFICNDYFETNFQNNKFDAIMCSFGIKHLSDQQISKLVTKTVQLLNFDGEILILELVKPNNKIVQLVLNLYLKYFLSLIFNEYFKPLYPVIVNFKNMDDIKEKFISYNLITISHNRYCDLFEILHLKKIKN
ncbi:putative ubiquinone/menaquinone biosynthesis methyltransferase [Flavobacterium branchiophilum]|uniref:Probable ubiquinone/menaquinone biosynthesis methyltransferase n=1 Tax=Flavobacterium branchiophilum (strain FL-15) TaxID=1034807 RepID=G2Z3H4_FLABF|nr:class I SAM-dependent methyltransferase [Flavobacterium branchiophilum]CCB70423.1 Probable ubiquinone/menaquinone biosynthesis methyltransferase [Flavobacterium branchiophilum FL-15]